MARKKGTNRFVMLPSNAREGHKRVLQKMRLAEALVRLEMLDPKTGRMQNRKVNVDGEAYECACAYMIKLERDDFENEKQLARLAAVVKMTPAQFRKRFGYLVGLK